MDINNVKSTGPSGNRVDATVASATGRSRTPAAAPNRSTLSSKTRTRQCRWCTPYHPITEEPSKEDDSESDDDASKESFSSEDSDDDSSVHSDRCPSPPPTNHILKPLDRGKNTRWGCMGCDAVFSSISGGKEHVIEELHLFVCRFCGYKFRTSDCVKSHEQHQHGKVLAATFTG
ncbi:hypothetical protein M422DRAFT_774060 [Sphaerobolus stellatus SS14]|nr:hypothetical protein M422DRAFT_774060 [Sphaerobolus stellatus SS14]